MVSMIFKQMLRKPIPLLAAICFSTILSGVLCGLHAMNVAEQKNYEEIFSTVPVSITVTDLTGNRSSGLDARRWVYNAFTSPYEMGEYITDIRIKMTADIQSVRLNNQPCNCSKLIGITSLESDIDLFQGGEHVIEWKEGYDASVLSSDAFVCIVPSSMISGTDGANSSVKLSFSSAAYTDGQVSETWNYDCTLNVIGTHSLGNNVIYCPFSIVKTIYTRLEDPWHIDSISGTLTNNYLLAEMWGKASEWFVEANPMGVKTPWDYSWYTYFPFALVVDDSQLIAAADTLENSIKTNQLCTLVVFLLSIAASFLVGFLTIRYRKREITLMRTIGTTNIHIYFGFAFEQMLCIMLGAILGGTFFLWRPAERLVIFVGIYFIGLSISLLFFMHTNLISTMKEDE